MHYPIIELRENTLFVSNIFLGRIRGTEMMLPYNRVRNLTRHVIDSRDDLWNLSYRGNDCVGFRKLISYVSSISHDYYQFDVVRDIQVGRLRDLISRYAHQDHPDSAELAADILESNKQFSSETPLKSVIHEILR